MLVYHSSDQCFTNPDVAHSREALDFGKGFYVTRLKEQAEKYANRFLRIGSDAYLHIFEYSPDPVMKVKIFGAYDEEWLDFVCNCRKGNDIYKEYDIIEEELPTTKSFGQLICIWPAYTTKNRHFKILHMKCRIISCASFHKEP